jgi:dipeptidyl-peptidase-4
MQSGKVSVSLRQVIFTKAMAVIMLCAGPAMADTTSGLRVGDGSEIDDGLTLEALYTEDSFADEKTGPIRWLKDGSGYTILEEPAAAESDPGTESSEEPEKPAGDDAPPKELVLYDPSSSSRRVLIDLEALTPAGEDQPLVIEDYSWSEDRRHLLIYTNSEKVWRSKSRGDYWLMNMETGSLRKVGGDEPGPSSLMFAKFSPDGTMLAYVHGNEIYAESIQSGEITRLTTDAFATVINGVFDWAYEEEFLIRDGFRWSPDSARIAFWQLDTSGSKDFILINNTEEDYPKLQYFPYPKVGETIAAARIGSVSAQGGDVTWASLSGDPRTMYIPRMDWASNSEQIMIQHLNRKQDTIDVYYADALTGELSPVFG